MTATSSTCPNNSSRQAPLAGTDDDHRSRVAHARSPKPVVVVRADDADSFRRGYLGEAFDGCRFGIVHGEDDRASLLISAQSTENCRDQ